MSGRAALLGLLVAAVLPASASASAITFTGPPDEGGWVKTRDVTVQFSASAGAECAVDGGAFTACADSASATGLADGAHSVSVRAGGETATRTFKVDATAPIATLSGDGGVIAPPFWAEPGTFILGGASVLFSVEEANLATTECRIDDAAFGACSFPGQHKIHCQPNGDHTFQLRLTDKAGNVTVASRAYTLRGWIPNPSCPVVPVAPDPDLSDTSSSTVSFTGGIAAGAWSRARDVTLEFTAAGAECAVDDGAFVACDRSFTAGGLADGTHSISVRAGGQPAAVRRFRVDATAPVANLSSRPKEGEVYAPPLGAGSSFLYNEWITFFPEDDHLATTECRVDDGAFGACDAPNHENLTCLPNGAHVFQLRLTDRAGNVTLTTRTFTFKGWARALECPPLAPEPEPDLSDTPSSTVTFTGGIAAGAWSRERDVTVAFTASTAECALDDGAFAACSGSFTATGLADGTHAISVRAGGQAPAVRRFRVDTTPPVIEIGSRPREGESIAFVPSQFMPGPMALGLSLITFLVDEAHLATAQCRFDDDEGFAACDGPADYSEYYNCLPNGTHTFQARATDKAGNETFVSRTFTLAGWSPATDLSWHCDHGHVIRQRPVDPPPPAEPRQQPQAPVAKTAVTVKPAVPYVALSSHHTKRWTKLRKLKLIDAPKGAKVKVSCKGCGGKTVRKLSDLTGRKLKPGTRVTIKVAAHTIKITIRAGRAPLMAT
jgi:large repetitive protein